MLFSVDCCEFLKKLKRLLTEIAVRIGAFTMALLVPSLTTWQLRTGLCWLWLSLFGGYSCLAQRCWGRVSSFPEAHRSFRLMVVICYHLPSSQRRVTSVSERTPSLLLLTVCIPEAIQLCLARLPVWGWKCVCFWARTVHRREVWVWMGVTNPGSFLSSIPGIYNKAAAYTGGGDTFWGNCQHQSSGPLALSWVTAFTYYSGWCGSSFAQNVAE